MKKIIVFILLLVSFLTYGQIPVINQQIKQLRIVTPISDIIAPTAPSNLLESNVTEISATLNWTASTDAVGVTNYKIYDNGALLATVGSNATSYPLTGLSPSTIYSLTVRAFDAAQNESSDSNVEVFQTLEEADVTAPTAPTSLTASNITNTTVDLTWGASTDLVSVVIYRIYNSGSLVATFDSSITSRTLTGLTSGTTYNLTVRGVDSSDNESSDSNIETFQTTSSGDATPPTAPSSLVSSNVTDTTVDLTWVASTDNVGLAGYRAYDDTPTLLKQFFNTTSGTITGLTPNTSYTITLRGIDAAENESGDSNVINFTTTAPSSFANVLHFTKTAGYDHGTKDESANLMNDIVTNLGITYTTDNTGDEFNSVANLNNYDIIFFSNTSGDFLNSSQRANLETWAASGGHFMGTHAAADAYGHSTSTDLSGNGFGVWDWYAENVTGASVQNNPNHTNAGFSAQLTITNPNSILTNNITFPYTEDDEYYYWEKGYIDGDFTELIEVADTGASSWDDPRMAGHFYNRPDGGRSFYTSLGHDQNEYDSEQQFTQLIENAIVWCMTNVIVDATAPTAPSSFTASNVASTSVFLSWTASTDNVGVTDYRIYNSGSLIASVGSNNTSYSVIGLSANTTYNLTVRGVDAAGNESSDSNSQSFTTSSPEATTTNNLADEEDYFAAHLVTVADRATLQSAMDTYGATVGVRLEPGNYCTDGGGFGCAATPLVMSSNMKLYGHPSATNPSNTPNITIAAGSTGVELRKLWTPNIVFEAGAPITNCKITSIQGNISTIGGQLEDNLFVDIRARLNLDCSVSGYLRNNTFLRHQVSAGTGHWVMHGNDVTPSYGAVHMAVNILNPWDNGTDISGIQDLTIIGLDAEAWNWQSLSPNAMLYMRNMGTVRISDLGGSIAGYLPPSSWTPSFDIEAEKLNIYNSGIYNVLTSPSIITGDGDVFDVVHKHSNFSTNAGYDARVFFNPGDNSVSDTQTVLYEGSEITTPISSGAAYDAFIDGILTPQRTPYDRIVHETLPNPTGGSWAANRVGQTDSHDFIQNLIDTNTIAELPEGIFYIGSPLTLINDQGIIGQGTGKTAIVGLTDDFPLIESYNLNVTTGIYQITVSNMTLQGGESGLKFIANTINSNDTMSVFSTLDFLIFRNQQSGFHLYQIFGMDNHMMNQVSYVDCGVGFHQDPKRPWEQEFATMTYVDKVLFYKNQFINCGTGVQMEATRANNLDTFYGCNYDANGISVKMSATNYGQFINSDFTNNTGEYVFGGGAHLYSCDFTGNTTTNVLNGNALYLEGCNLNDNIPLMASGPHAIKTFIIRNSTVAGTLGVQNRINRAVFMNTSFPNVPSLNKLLVTRKENDPDWDNPFEFVIIDQAPNPYPQFLVKYTP